MSVAQVRALVGDIAKWERQETTGDGVTKNYTVTKYPVITNSQTVTVSGSTQTPTTHYVLSPDLGLIAFVTAPSDEAPIVVQYAWAQLSDETISTFLTLNSNVYMAAAMAAESLAGKYAELVDKSIGDLKYSYGQRSKQYAALAKQLRDSASRNGAVVAPYVGGISISDKQTRESDSDWAKTAFRVGMHDYEDQAQEQEQ